jgi:hypothetical protein
MDSRTSRVRSSKLIWQGIVVIAGAALLMPREFVALAQGTTPAPAGATEPAAAKLPPEQLESLVAPIALYPDRAPGADARGSDLSARDRSSSSSGF